MATSKNTPGSRRKLALIIGNENYESNNKLIGCRKNANDLCDVLEKLNFITTKAVDANKHDMANKISEFLSQIKDGDLILFYFSGHVYQFDGKKFLLPVNDANLEEEMDIEEFAIEFDRTVTRIVKKNPSCATVFILDYFSSYNLTNETRTDIRTKSSDLSEMQPPSETFIQFSGDANQTNTLLPGTGQNSLFTKHLLRTITEENLPISELFQRVRDAVYQESNRMQKPLSMDGLQKFRQISLNEVVIERLRMQDFLTDEPISPEENIYYEKCKEYYYCTGKPLISVANEIHDSNTQLNSLILKFGIDVDNKQCDLHDYLSRFCKSANINLDNLEVKKVQKGSTIVTVGISDKIQLSEKRRCLELIYKSCNDRLPNELALLNTFFLLMGPEDSLRKMQKFQATVKLNPKFNRLYIAGRDYWSGSLNDGKDRGGSPYYCPVGWRRWSFYVCDNFDEKFSGWCICYHGTKFEYGLSILLNGLKPAVIAALGKGIYTTPSIIYACHPRYAEVKEIPPAARKMFKSGKYIQYVLECRVRPNFIKRVGWETLRATTRIDPNIENESIEWVIDNQSKAIVDFNDPNAPIVCTGLMIRITDDHPGLLPQSKWWYQSHICQDGKCCWLGIDLPVLEQRLLHGYQCNIIND